MCGSWTARLIPSSRILTAALVLVVILAALGVDRCWVAWYDGSAYASCGVNWHLSGCTGSSVRPGEFGHSMTVAPVHSIALGTWFKLVGVGLTQARVFHLVAYLGALLLFYLLVRKLGCSLVAAQAATLLVGVDRWMIRPVRGGRPEPFVVLLVLGACYALAYASRSSDRRKSVVAAAIGGMFLVLAPLSHPYSVPAVAVVGIAFLVVCFRSRQRVALLGGFFFGCLPPLLCYGGYLWTVWDTIAESYARAAAYIKEPSDQTPGIGERLVAEFSRRWGRWCVWNPFCWLLVSGGIGLCWRKQRPIAIIALLWLVTYYLVLALFIPKFTSYQLAYVVPALGVLVALVIDAAIPAISDTELRGSRLRVAALLLLWWCSLLVCILAMARYPALALLQWHERSHANLVSQIRLHIPEHSVMAVEESAYFASLANKCTTYYVRFNTRQGEQEARQLSRQGESPWTGPLQQRYFHELLLHHGVEYVLLYHNAPAPLILPGKDWSLRFLTTLGVPKRPLSFDFEPDYHYDLYKVIRPLATPNVDSREAGASRNIPSRGPGTGGSPAPS